jgi:hypothetical protein
VGPGNVKRQEAAMGFMDEIELAELPAEWETWRCTAASCPEELLRAGRRAPGEDVWLIGERPGWLMVATVPVCPACGSTLRREP